VNAKGGAKKEDSWNGRRTFIFLQDTQTNASIFVFFFSLLCSWAAVGGEGMSFLSAGDLPLRVTMLPCFG